MEQTGRQLQTEAGHHGGKTNVFGKPSAEPNLFGFCRGEKTTM